MFHSWTLWEVKPLKPHNRRKLYNGKEKQKYLEAAKKIDSSKAYSVEEAIALAKETDFAKFDASVEVAYRLGLDPKKADQHYVEQLCSKRNW